MKRRPVVGALVATSATFAASLAAGPALAAPTGPIPIECPTALPTDEAVPGMVGQGWTVERGTEPEPFTAKVIGVLKGRVDPGTVVPAMDLIMVEVASPAIARAGGIWAGASGSPVYAPDGKLIGALSHGLATSTTIVGLTPATELARLLTANPEDGRAEATTPRPEASRIKPAAGAVRTLVGTGKVTREQAEAGFSPLRVPLSISGPTGTNQTAALKSLERTTGQPVIGAPTSRASAASAGAVAARQGIFGGSNFAVGYAYGDITLSSTGTTTYTCNGQAVAFGHRYLGNGITNWSAHEANAVLVQPDPGGNSTPIKYANVGQIHGIVDRDLSMGIRAKLGPAPTGTQITSSLTRDETGRTRTATTTSLYQPFLVDVALTHATANVDDLLGVVASKGSAQLTLSVTGKRADGNAFAVTVSQRLIGKTSEGQSLINEVTAWIQSVVSPLIDQEFDAVTIDAVRLTGSVSSQVAQWISPQVQYSQNGVYGSYPNGLTTEVGQLLRTRTTFAQRYTPSVRTTVNAALKIPASARGRDVEVIVTGGPSGQPYDPTEFLSSVTSFPQILAKLRAARRADEVTAQLVDLQTGKVYVTKRIRLTQPVIPFEKRNPLQVR